MNNKQPELVALLPCRNSQNVLQTQTACLVEDTPPEKYFFNYLQKYPNHTETMVGLVEAQLLTYIEFYSATSNFNCVAAIK